MMLEVHISVQCLQCRFAVDVIKAHGECVQWSCKMYSFFQCPCPCWANPLRDWSVQPPCFSIIARASDCSLDCKCEGQLTLERLEEWRGRRRPEEARDWVHSVCTVGHRGNNSGSATRSIFNLISKNHAGDRSLSCVCVLSVPPVMTRRPVLCALVEKRIYITPGTSEEKTNPDVRTFRGGSGKEGGRLRWI